MRSSHLGILATLIAGVFGLLAYLVFAEGVPRESDSYEVFGAERSTAAELDSAQERTAEARGDRENLGVTADLASAGELEEQAASELVDLSLRGRVVSAAGVPLSGARILVDGDTGWLSIPLNVEAITGITGWRHSRETSTNELGEFSFAELDSGEYVLEALDDEHRPFRQERLRYSENKGLDVGDLLLEEGAVLRGQVVDERGRSVTGVALLESLGHPGEKRRTVIPGRGRPIGESGANGRFSLANLVPGELHVIADSTEHLPVEVEAKAVLAGGAVEDLVIRVVTGSALEGQVEGVALERLSRLRIVARMKNGSSSTNEDPTARRPRTVSCDENGAFRFGGLAGGQDYRLTAFEISADEDQELERLPAIAAVYARPGDAGVVLALKKPLQLRFRVLNDVTGAPVTSFVVRAGFEDAAVLEEAGETKREHPGGLVQFRKLHRPEGTALAHIVIRAVGFAELKKDNLQLKDGEENDQGDLRLIPAPRLLVTVTEKNTGDVVSGAYVFAGKSASKQTLTQLVDAGAQEQPLVQANIFGAPVDEYGVAALGLITGEASLIYVVAEGFATTEFPEQHFRGTDDVELTAELIRGSEVRVHVSDQLGRPVEGVVVLHHRLDDVNQTPQWLEIKADWKTDSKGNVVFEALASGDHGFRLLKAEEEANALYVVFSMEDEWQWVTTKDGESTELKLTALRRSTLSGIVYENGVPLAEASLDLVVLENGEPRRERWRRGGFGAPAEDPTKTRTDETGNYRFLNVTPGEYLVRISHANRYMTQEVRITTEVESTEVDLRLSVASIEGRITNTDGLPLVDISVKADTEGRARTRSWNRGSFEIGEDEEGSMTFNTSSTVGGSGSTGGSSSEVRTDSDGRYAFRAVRGDEVIQLDIGEGLHSPVSEELSALGPNEVRRGVDFVLEAAGVISCTVVGMPAGTDRIRARAEFLEVGPHQGESKTRSIRRWNSRFSFESLLPGRWKLELSLQDGTVLRTLEPQVVAGQSTELTIEFP